MGFCLVIIFLRSSELEIDDLAHEKLDTLSSGSAAIQHKLESRGEPLSVLGQQTEERSAESRYIPGPFG